ncbi:MAG TPA: hypothetical protein VJ872_05825, partial [Nocardioides sp.]|nr:hypothetical protein [Nocardioides sp.]
MIRKVLAMVAAAGLAAFVAAPAHANWDPPTSSSSQSHASTPTYTTSYDSPATTSEPAVHCTVYANGTGMGSYCASLAGGGVAQTLRERFGGLPFQRCRYREVPSTWLVRPNPDPEHGRYMVQICLGGIDWDTVTGGPNRQVDIDVVWVPNTQDVNDEHNAVDDFMWGLVSGDAQLPVPMLITHPATPVVGE